MSWKFFHNGYTWWLRIDNPEDLARYCELTDDARYGGSMMQVAYHRMDGCKTHLESMPSIIDALSRFHGEDLLTTTGKLLSEAHFTYFKNLARFGFVNINRLGGCNSSNWPAYATVVKEELIFPHYLAKMSQLKHGNGKKRSKEFSAVTINITGTLMLAMFALKTEISISGTHVKNAKPLSTEFSTMNNITHPSSFQSRMDKGCFVYNFMKMT